MGGERVRRENPNESPQNITELEEVPSSAKNTRSVGGWHCRAVKSDRGQFFLALQ